ncbi:MAG: FtsX-like permease family protein [Planctomycetes bacterium]|nr:FtsX-like permease family protein [Planctomycetota bacterium]
MQDFKNNPLRFTQWVLEKILPSDEHYEKAGDLEEGFFLKIEEKGNIHAKAWLWMQTIKILPVLLNEKLFRSSLMFKNYILISLRNFTKNKGFTFLNLSGLAIGLASCILILMYIFDELSYDKYHENAENIYRLETDLKVAGDLSEFAITGGGMGPDIVEEIPGVENYVRIFSRQVFGRNNLQARFNETIIKDIPIIFTDSTFFSVFTYEFLQGNPADALKEPNSIVITQSAAENLFGAEDPFGKTIIIHSLGDFHVKGVIKDVPDNSHLTFDYVVTGEIRSRTWLSMSLFTYLVLDENSDPISIESKINGMIESKIGETGKSIGLEYDLVLRRLTDIHLTSNREYEFQANGNILYVKIFGAAAVLILLLACVNFMSLSTACSTNRAKEVGLRKVLGANKNQLINQFLSESVLLAVLGLLLSVVLVLFALPWFRVISGKELSLTHLMDWKIIACVFALMGFTGLLAGSYPAFLLSAFKPVTAIKGVLIKNSGQNVFRKSLVILQFSLSVALISCTFIILDQLEYMKNKDLGFDKDEIVVFTSQDRSTGQRWKTVEGELKSNTNITDVAFSNSVPGHNHSATQFVPEGNARNASHLMNFIYTDYDFIKTYGIQIAHGRDFSVNFETDSAHAFIINESAAITMGWDPAEAVDKDFTLIVTQFDKHGKVVGVMKNFHAKSVKTPIEPMVFTIGSNFARFASIRINTENITETMDFLKGKWKEFEPGYDVEYFFLDDDYDKAYKSEEKLGSIFTTYAVLAIFIACLGLFGLATYTAEQRVKEICVRKVLGAKVKNIVYQLTNDFTRHVLISNLFGLPSAYIFMKYYWLSNFPYAISVGIKVFATAGAITFIISLATISYKTFKSALANPVDSLRNQ